MKNYIALWITLFVWGVSGAEARSTDIPVPDSSLLSGKWPAEWITSAEASVYEYGVYHFRKAITLDKVPQTFVVNISADNRYRFFVNGQSVCWGPARGDIAHWYFETVDIASYLQPGKNVLAVQVWNFGEWTPGAQMTLKTGLIVQGNTAAESSVNTNASWKVMRNPAYAPSLDHRMDVGCADIVRALLYPWEWETSGYDDSRWKAARCLGHGQPYGTGTGYDWVLLPRDIPLMEESLLRMRKVRRADGIDPPETFLRQETVFTIPAGKKVSILIDQEFLTTAYPELHVSGGKDACIRLTYSEALFNGEGKANRNEIAGRDVVGFADVFYPDGGSKRSFRPLWFKTYRYIRMDVETAAEPLVIHDLYGKYTGYPFKENASFVCSDPRVKDIWTVGWRTARLCAHETYFDCPYYEQLQYVGDTRIQALISLYIDGDDRLMRKAIRMFDWSRSYEGITASRYPSRVPQYIPPFSLYWINMVHDYWMHRDDPEFVQSCLPGIKTILEWFASKIDSRTGMLGPVPHWNFVDWPKQWPWSNDLPAGGVPPGGITGGSSVLSLQLAYTLKDAVELLQAFGELALASRYSKLYTAICKGTRQACWDSEKQLFSDNRARTSYSQHANIMGILSGAVPEKEQRDLFDRTDKDPSLIQATFYYRFYLFRALKKVGLADRYMQMLHPWYDMLDIGLSTFAENPEPTRSDCHAWSASPVYDFLSTVCGVEPASPGFKTVKIEPHPGNLSEIQGVVPHPTGMIRLFLKTAGKNVEGEVTLPEGLSGTFIWKGKRIVLKSGATIIDL